MPSRSSLLDRLAGVDLYLWLRLVVGAGLAVTTTVTATAVLT